MARTSTRTSRSAPEPAEKPARRSKAISEDTPARTRRTKEAEAPDRSRRVKEEAVAPTRKKRAVAEVEEAPARSRRTKAAPEEAVKKTRRSRLASADEETSSTALGSSHRESKSPKRKAATEIEVKAGFNPYAKLDDVLDGIEKHIGLTDGGMSSGEKRMSTGLLMNDIILGGGITAGWYTNFGQEQTCKTTNAVTMLISAINTGVPIIGYWDFEGSAGPEYIENIMRNMGVKADIKSVFGVKDEKTGKWIIPPRVRYRSEAVAEKFFDYVAQVQRSLPDKKKIGENWYYIYDGKTSEGKINKASAAAVGSYYDKEYYRKTGNFRVPAPDGSLQAIILVDSYPAMLPEKQDVDDPNSAIGVQARMFAEQLRRVKGKMRGKRIAVLGINQLRLKPMVMMGCLHGSTKVQFVDGRVHTMKQIVDGKIKGEVWSMNEATGALEPKAIKAWHYNGEVTAKEDWLKVTARNPMSKSGFSVVPVTRDHEIQTQRGWIKARKLRLSDKVFAKTTSMLRGKFGQFLAGSLSADSTIVQDCKSNAYLRLQDNENLDYLAWKLDKLSSGLDFSQSTCGEGKTVYCSTRSPFFVSMKNKIGERDPTVFDHTPLSLAVMYMDDGSLKTSKDSCTISFKRFKNNEAKLGKICSIFAKYGIDASIYAPSGCLSFDILNSNRFFKLIRHYVPSPMQYKLTLEHRGYYKDFSLNATESVAGEFVEITKIETGADRLFRQRGKYDISVADNRNYLAGCKDGGFIVHNSPEYEPCGEALKLYSDCRLKHSSRALSAISKVIGEGVKGNGQIEEEPSVTFKHGVDNYRYINVRAHKNKLSRPYLEAWLRLWITDGKGNAQGFDPVFDSWMYLKSTGQLTGKRGKMLLQFKGNPASKYLGWLDFKRLIIGDRATMKGICQAIGMKPCNLREKCFAQLASGDGIDLFNQNELDKRSTKAEKEKEPLESDLESEDDND